MPDDLIREARERFDDAVSADQDNREAALEDLRFRAGEQWPGEIKAERAKHGRPTLTVNRIPQFVRQVIGDVRLRPPSIKVRPMDGRSSKQIADTYTGIIRNIEQQSQAELAYIKAVEHSIVCGLGHFRVCTDYRDDDDFDQDIRIDAIPNPFAVVWDHGARDQLRLDARFCFVTSLLSTAEFRRRYPKASMTDFDTPVSTQLSNWTEGNYIRVAEYWWIDDEQARLIQLGDGAVLDATKIPRDMIAQIAAERGVVRERMATRKRVRQCIINGAEQLTDVYDHPGKYLPIVPVVGEEVDVGDRVVRHGLVRFMRDPQLMYNIHRSALAESIAMAPKPKWLVTPDMIAGHEQWWSNANTNNYAYLPYNPDMRGGAPQRIAPDVPAASLLQEIGLAASDLEAVTGIYRAALGAPSNETSGRAIMARQREGDVGTYTYPDNLATAVMHAGRILVDMIPRIYDTERVVRTLGEDGSEDFTPINVTTIGPDGQVMRLHDLSVGKYDVAVSVGPSFTTKREETREGLLAFVQAYPPAAQLLGDIIAKNMDFPGADEAAKRLRKVMPPGIVEPEEGEEPPPPPPPSPEQMKAQADAQKAQMDTQVKAAEMQLERERMGLERERMMQDAALAERKMQLEAAKLHIEAQKVRVEAMRPPIESSPPQG